jgi:enolase
MDVASSEFYDNGKYDLAKKSRTKTSNEPMLSGKELAAFYKDMCRQFPIKSIEDAFDQVGILDI